MAPVRKRTRVEQARQYLGGGAIFREDSDDELGYEDHPWEWIYEDSDAATTAQNATPRKRRAAALSDGRRIVAARMGTFTCKLGDAVLLKAEGNHAWVGIICDFFEDEEEDEKMAKFMWFSSEKEIRNKSTKRTDHLPVQSNLSRFKLLLLTQKTERALHIGRIRRQPPCFDQRHGKGIFSRDVQPKVSQRPCEKNIARLRQGLCLQKRLQHTHNHIHTRVQVGGCLHWRRRHSCTGRACGEPNKSHPETRATGKERH